jgi:hypothetical protein
MVAEAAVHGVVDVRVGRSVGRWRWRESNPRPSVQRKGFSGRSLQLIFSAPAVTQASC